MTHITAPKWMQEAVEVYNRHLGLADKIAEKIGKYLERIDYETQPDWGGRIPMKIVSGKVSEKDDKKYLKVDGYNTAKANNDGVYVHQVAGYCGDDFSGEFYIPCGDDKFIQVHFSM